MVKTNIKKVSDETIIESYNRLNNVWKVAKEVGLCGQSVWERLKKLSLINKIREPHIRKFKDYDILKEKYLIYRDRGDLDLLAKELGRTKQFVCRKAKELGLTSLNHKKTPTALIALSKRMKEYHATHDHPRGMLGKNHSKKSCSSMSVTRKALWKSYSKEEQVKRTKVKLKARIAKYGTMGSPHSRKASWKQGWRTISGNAYFFRSRWEFNYALILEFLKTENKIKEWSFETRVFEFEQEDMFAYFYRPDFEVILLDGKIKYHEVKGWMCPRSKQKFQLMRKWYPDVKIIIIDAKWFKKNKQFESLEGWEPMTTKK